MRLALLLLSMSVGCMPCSKSLSVPDPGLQRMIDQPRADPLEATPLFESNTVVRIPPAGTVPFGPEPSMPPLTLALLDDGERLFNTTCAACHAVDGSGDTVVARHMRFVKPPSLHAPRLREKPPQHFYDVATHGYGLMPSYRGHLDDRERFAVAWYVKALQLSRRAPLAALPPDIRAALEGVP